MQWTDLTPYGLLEVAGTGAFALLQGQLTCHLGDITEESSRLAAQCTPQGRVISFFRLFTYQKKYYLQMPKSLIPITLSALQKYAVFFDVTLHDVSEAFIQRGYFTKAETTWPDTEDQQLTENDAIIIREKGETLRYLWIGRKDSIISCDPSKDNTYSDWHRATIHHLVPTIYPETSEKFFAHELNLTALNAVSFTKGCYTGQEIIARMHYLGKPKNTLQYKQLESIPSLTRGSTFVLDPQDTTKKPATIVDFCTKDKTLFDILMVAPSL